MVQHAQYCLRARGGGEGGGGKGTSHFDWWGPATLWLRKGPKNLSESLKIRLQNLSVLKGTIRHPDSGYPAR